MLVPRRIDTRGQPSSRRSPAQVPVDESTDGAGWTHQHGCPPAMRGPAVLRMFAHGTACSHDGTDGVGNVVERASFADEAVRALGEGRGTDVQP